MRKTYHIAALLATLAGCGARAEPGSLEGFEGVVIETDGVAFEPTSNPCEAMTERSRAQKPPTQPVDTYQPTHGPWTANNQLGYETPFQPSANNRQTVLKMDENGPPQIWTVALGIEGVDAFNDGVSVTAEIDFGAGGTTQRVEVDWLEGTVISFVTNSINVQAFWGNLDPGETDDALLRVTVGRYGCSRFNAQKTINKQRLLGIGAPIVDVPNGIFTLGAGGFLAGAVIPKFTRQVRVVPVDQNAAELNAFFSSDFRAMTTGQPATARRNIIRGSEIAAAGAALPLVADSRYIRVENNTAESIDFMLIADLF